MKKFNLSKEQLKIQPIEREEPKIGRNDLCLCGSGLKFKKCCLVLETLTKQLERAMDKLEEDSDGEDIPNHRR